MKLDNLLFGAAYYSEYMPYERTDKDMQLMKDACMNVIRIAESTWSTWEPADNVYNFEKLHGMLKAAEAHNMKVIIGTPTYAIPPWLYEKYPDILAYTKNGRELYGHRQLTDITNPHYLFHAEHIIRKLMDEIKDYPHIIGFQLDNETRSAGAASPETQKLFVAKMKEKYKDIDKFNDEFGLDYWSNRITSWETFPDVRGTINGSLSAAYKRFLRDCITDFLKWQSDILKEYMRPEQFITHNFDFSWIGHSFGIQPEVNQFDAVKCMDIAGVDIYHPSQDKLTGAEIAFGGAVGRALSGNAGGMYDSSSESALSDNGSNYIVLETQSQGNLSWLPYPGQLKLQAYSHLSSGASGVMYWNWHSIHNSFESYWKGVLSHDLTPSDDYYELKSFGQEMRRLEPHLRNLKKLCSAAILTDNQSLVGLDEFPISDKLNYNEILREFYDSCYELNLECDIVSKDSDFSQYSLLIIPALYSASEELISKIKDYVRCGGQIILGFKSCFSDEELKIYHEIQPYLMTDCIGASYSRFTRPENTGLRFTKDFCDTSSDISDTVYPVTEWIELLRADSAEVWASYVHKYWGNFSAVTYNKFGKGGALYIACHTTKDALKLIIKKMCGLSNIKLTDFTFPIIKKSGINEAGKMINYYFNYSSNPEKFVYDGPTGTELISGSPIKTGDETTLPEWSIIITESSIH